jgi:hypothetical protein
MLAGCSPFASKGTMPPPGPNGQVDGSSAPDFIAVAGEDGGIAGYVRKEAVVPPGDGSVPVYADDLRTVVGEMVPDKGFIPAGVDPLTVPKRPVTTAPSSGPSPAGGSGVALYVRNDRAGEIWVAVQTAGQTTGGGGFWGQTIAVGCYPMAATSRLVLLDRSATEPGASVMRVIYVRAAEPTPPTLWITIARDGAVEQGTGIPAWWTGPPSC